MKISNIKRALENKGKDIFWLAEKSKLDIRTVKKIIEEKGGNLSSLKRLLPPLEMELAGTYYRFGEDIGSYIKRMRRQQGLIQRDLVQKGTLSIQSITNIERGYTNTELQTLKIILEKLQSDLHVRPKFERKEAWVTKDFAEQIHRVIPLFDLDAAAPLPEVGTSHIQAKKIFTIRDNSLTQNWGNSQKIWINPPYQNGVIQKWFLKGLKVFEKSENIILCYLIPSNIEANYFTELIIPNASLILIIKGRQIYQRPDTSTSTGRMGTALCIFQKGFDDLVIDFKEVFNDAIVLSERGKSTFMGFENQKFSKNGDANGHETAFSKLSFSRTAQSTTNFLTCNIRRLVL